MYIKICVGFSEMHTFSQLDWAAFCARCACSLVGGVLSGIDRSIGQKSIDKIIDFCHFVPNCGES